MEETRRVYNVLTGNLERKIPPHGSIILKCGLVSSDSG
jgi:hypothetical protein